MASARAPLMEVISRGLLVVLDLFELSVDHVVTRLRIVASLLAFATLATAAFALGADGPQFLSPRAGLRVVHRG